MSPDITIMITAQRRPYYFEESLKSWSKARGIEDVRGFHVAFGPADRDAEMTGVASRSALATQVSITWTPDPKPGMGMHWAIGNMMHSLFGQGSGFVVATEEDVVVSDDTLEYFTWAAEQFRADNRVLAVCAHSVGGQHWDQHVPVDDGDADQQQVRLLPYFNAWCWGTWADRWPSLHRFWDWDCSSGNGHNGFSGWDFNIATRILPGLDMLCAVPDASRTQNIGRMEGWASNEWSFSFSQAQSFRPHRDPAPYTIGAAGETHG